MSNKKLSRLLEPNLKFYFAVMLLFAVAAIPVNWQLALAEGTLTVLLYFYFRQSNQKRRQGVLQYIDPATGSVDTALFPARSWGRIQKELLYQRPELLQRGEMQGDAPLRTQIAEYLSVYRGVECTPEQIVVGAGIEYLLGCLAHLFSDGMAAIENPGYFRTRTVLQNSGIPCTLVDIDREGLPADALEKSGANLCYLTPSHHFPTGVTMPATRRAQLLAWAAARPGRYILEDDYDSEFRFDTRPLPSLQGMAGPDGPVVYLTTFSKSLAPGIRIACMVLPQSLLARYRRDFATYANTVSRFEQQTLCEFMAGGYFTRHLARMRLAVVDEARQIGDVVGLRPISIHGDRSSVGVDAAERLIVFVGQGRGAQMRISGKLEGDHADGVAIRIGIRNRLRDNLNRLFR